ncbi:sulfatase/phosphatase domain-containing protein, partial [Phocaeicola sp. HCN-40430]
ESARMPFVIRYPKKIPAGKRLKDLVQNIDFAPTLAEFAGVEMKDVQGRSFAENLMGNTPKDWRKEIYYRYWTNHAIRPAHFGIRSDRYKLIFYYGQNLDMTDTQDFSFTPCWDFYDLQKDPKENHNAYNDKEYAPIIKKMKEDLLRLRKEAGDTDEKYPEMQ